MQVSAKKKRKKKTWSEGGILINKNAGDKEKAGLSAQLHTVEQEERCQSPTEWPFTRVHVCTCLNEIIGLVELADLPCSIRRWEQVHTESKWQMREPRDDRKNFLLPATLSSTRARGPDCCRIIGCGPHTQCQSLSSRLGMKFNEVPVYALLQVNFHSVLLFSYMFENDNWNDKWWVQCCKYVQAHCKVCSIYLR